MKDTIPHPNTVGAAGNNALAASLGVNPEVITKAVNGTHAQAAERLQVIEERQRGLFTRLFVERGLSKVLQEARIQEVKDFQAYRASLFRLATDTKLDMAHTMCLAMSRELKVGTQQAFTSMVLDKHESLRRTVQQKRDAFLEDIDAAFSNAEKYAHRPWLMDQAVGSLQREVGQFFTWVDQLLEDFLNISKERLDEYRRAEQRKPTVAIGNNNWAP